PGRKEKGDKNRIRKGQVLGEYVLILVLAMGAFTVMQVYVRRELQGRYKDAADKAVSDIRQAKHDASLVLQYEPYYSTTDVITTTDSRGNSVYSPGGKNVEVTDETIERRGLQMQTPLGYPYTYGATQGGQ
ncbi:MAG: hypothetical protein V1662_02935, partial [Candidatus Omnitrophota bacterium]